MGTVAFLVNPASAGGRTRRLWPEIAQRAAAAGLDGPAYLSERPGELPSLVAKAADAGAELIVVIGGDGTLNEVVGGLMQRRDDGKLTPELAMIPRGTGRDFVRTFRIPAALDDAIAVARDGEPRTVDAGRVEYRTWSGEMGLSYFANVASAGMSGAIAQRADSTTKALGGRISFVAATVAVFWRWRPTEMTVTVDGVERTATMHDVLVANCRYLGSGMKMCPEALPDDGLFDVLTIGNLTKSDLALTLPRTYRGSHLPHPKAELLRGAAVTVDAETEVPIELDGEQPGTTPARFEVIPGALRVRVSRGSTLA